MDLWPKPSLRSKRFRGVGEQIKEWPRNGILPWRNWGESQNKKEGVGEGKEGFPSPSPSPLFFHAVILCPWAPRKRLLRRLTKASIISSMAFRVIVLLQHLELEYMKFSSLSRCGHFWCNRQWNKMTEMNFTSSNFPETSALDQSYTKGTKKFKSPNSTFPFVEIETSLILLSPRLRVVPVSLIPSYLTRKENARKHFWEGVYIRVLFAPRICAASFSRDVGNLENLWVSIL